LNNSFCDSCNKVVPAERVERDGKIFLVKNCPDCGTTETLISNSAARSNRKRSLDPGADYRGCDGNCPACDHHRQLRFAFFDITNRCNMSCPMCCDNIPGLGFEFEPPMEYFDKIFKHLSEFKPRPTISFFGGEPTMRDDFIDMIKLARSYGFRARVFTNCLKLADMDYCREIVRTHAHLMLSYDGSSPDTYRVMRGNANVLPLKLKAIDNIGKLKDIRRRQATVISCIGKGLNDKDVPGILQFCHDRRDFIGCLYLMPLAHTWDRSKWDFEPDRMTTEDCEMAIADAFPGYDVDFLPLGFTPQFSTLAKYVGREAPPYGAHPNCESLYYLVSDGEKWVPMEHYLKRPVTETAKDLVALEKRLAAREKKWEKGLIGRMFGRLHLRDPILRLRGLLALLFFFVRQIRLGRLLKGRGLARVGHAIALPFALIAGRRSHRALKRHSTVQGHLQIIILPLEDNAIIETERLERCPTAHAYMNPRTEEVKFVPVCAWRMHNKKILRDVADYYTARGAATVASEGTAAGV